MGNYFTKKEEDRIYNYAPIHNLGEYRFENQRISQIREEKEDIRKQEEIERREKERAFDQRAEEIEKMMSFLSKKANTLLAKTKTGEVM